MRAHRTPRLKRFFKSLSQCTGGNAMMFVALGLPVLIGGAGYGLDMAQLYMWKRELQHSVDQAALAGAYALADNPSSTNYSTRAQQEFDANQKVTAGFASTPAISLVSYNGGDNNAVLVSANASKLLPFSGFLINKPLFIQVRAEAKYAVGATYKACLMTLKQNGTTFTVGGNATVHAKCGLGALSCSDDAITVGGSATVDTNSIVACGTVQVPTSLNDVVTEHANLSNPFTNVPVPQPTDSTARTYSCPKKGSAILSPGVYKGGINAKCNTTFNPGIYVIDGGTLDLTDQKAAVTGLGVMFVLKNGATISLSGQGNSGTINLSPMESGDFAGTVNDAYKDTYAGMLFFEDPTGQTTPVTDKIVGNANASIRGTMYLPNSNVTISGNSSTNPMCFQIWSSTISISGSATLTTTCSADDTLTAGTTAGGVSLVL